MSLDIASLFEKGQQDDYSEIIKSLLSPDNVELKTELPNPSALTSLQLLALWLEHEGFPVACDTIRRYVHQYRIDMVSNRRKSRTEVVTAVSELRQQNDLRRKMFGGGQP